MSLDKAILGWLSTGPGSGYDLVKQLDLGLSWFWSAAHSQIYPRLKALEAQGLITSETVTVGTKLEKLVYSITDAGRNAVQEWASQPPTYPPNRDDERLRLIFGDQGRTEDIRRHFETHLAHYEARLKELRAFAKVLSNRQHPRIERRIQNAPTAAKKELVLTMRQMAFDGDIERAELEIAWAMRGLSWLNEFESRYDENGNAKVPMVFDRSSAPVK
jgi:PadR family transcriptional regulator, regulatory protein AphA